MVDQNTKYLIHNTRTAYTLIEVLMVMSIFMLIALAVLANFHGNQGAQNLRAASNELAGSIRAAQGFALAGTAQNLCTTDAAVCGHGSVCDPTVTPPNCNFTAVNSYGVAFDITGDKKQYAIFSDTSTGVDCRQGCYNNGEAVGTGLITLPRNIIFQSVTQSAPPASGPAAIIFSNLTIFGSCSTCTTTVVLKDMVSGATRTVSFRDATGAITVQ
jgi:type II secretory pathway pseudopilin PulG